MNKIIEIKKFIWNLIAISCYCFSTACSQIDSEYKKQSSQNLPPIIVRSEDTQIKLSYPVQPQIVANAEERKEGKSKKLLENTEFLSFSIHSGEITAMALAADGGGVFTAGSDGNIVYSYLNNNSLSKVSELKTEHLLTSSRPVLAISPSPNGRYLAVGQFSLLVVYDLEQKRIVSELTRIDGRITSLAWDPKGGFLAIGRAGGDIFLWEPYDDDWREAQNRLDVLEQYSGGFSPIVKIIFHPSARVFFVAEREGIVSIWRMLRTEREMGLRDDNAIADQRKEGKYRSIIGNFREQIEDMELSSDGEDLIVTTATGKLYQWKVRGLKQEKTVDLENEAILDLTEIRENDLPPLYLGITRNQKIQIWCNLKPNKTDIKLASLAALGDQNAITSIEGPVIQSSQDLLVKESMVFMTPLSHVAFDFRNRILWTAQKNGSLLAFDTRTLDGFDYCKSK